MTNQLRLTGLWLCTLGAAVADGFLVRGLRTPSLTALQAATYATLAAILAVGAIGLRRKWQGWQADARQLTESPKWHRMLVREHRGMLIGLGCTWGFLGAATWAVYRTTDAPLPQVLLFVCGLATGSLAAAIVNHPNRVLGWVPYACLTTCALMLFGPPWTRVEWYCLFLGITGGLIHFPLHARIRHLHRSGLWKRPLWGTLGTIAIGLVAGSLIAHLLSHPQVLGTSGFRPCLFGIAVISCFVAWHYLLREAVELAMASFALIFYRIRAVGPGVNKFPLFGPAVIVSNHGCWLDPFWIGKVIPRQQAPMMTSLFYDLPVLNWLMRRVFRVIRVQDSRYRHHVPELDEAVRRLDRGECVIIFPEGWVRRNPDQVLRRFGQGIWRILKERPHTPVVTCWVDGSWGSFTSYWNGPPGSGKPIDFLHKITISLSEPMFLSTELLQEHLPARQFLMDSVLGLRQCLPVDSEALLKIERAAPTPIK